MTVLFYLPFAEVAPAAPDAGVRRCECNMTYIYIILSALQDKY